MNGQEARQRIVRQLFDTISIEAIVETGTFRGSSTKYFAGLGRAPVHTVESHPRYFAYSRLRFVLNRSVHVDFGDSREFLRSLAADPAFPRQRIFFYLDAHWGADLPLSEELSIIVGTWSDAVILIDDFEVYDDPGYGFDDYGPGRRLSANYLPDRVRSRYVPLYPAARSEDETGKKRGCIVLLDKELESVVPALTELRDASAGFAVP